MNKNFESQPSPTKTGEVFVAKHVKILRSFSILLDAVCKIEGLPDKISGNDGKGKLISEAGTFNSLEDTLNTLPQMLESLADRLVKAEEAIETSLF